MVVRTALIILALFVPAVAAHARPVAAARAGPPGPVVWASGGPAAAVLVDVETGRTLYERAPDRRLPPASTTKVLTAMLVIDRLRPDAVVRISQRAAGQRSGATVGVRAGERWRVEDLLHAMMLRSANDAAVALAEATSGTVERFVDEMNRVAPRLGARHTHFTSAHGLNGPTHLTTARDLAVITRHALRRPRFNAVVGARRWVVARPGAPPLELVNTNRLLERYPGADGVKTGQTAAAGYTLVGSATRGGWRLLVVVLRATDPFADAAALLDHGFSSFARVRVGARGQRFAVVLPGRPARRVEGALSGDVVAIVRRGATVSTRVVVRPGLGRPLAATVPLATVEFLEDGEVVARAPLVAARAVAP